MQLRLGGFPTLQREMVQERPGVLQVRKIPKNRKYKIKVRNGILIVKTLPVYFLAESYFESMKFENYNKEGFKPPGQVC